MTDAARAGDDRRVAVVIEDEADIRDLLEQVLQQAGFETHGAVNGLDGVEAVRKWNPTVTTLDVSMPGIDGVEAAKRIRTFSDTYLIMLTARSEEIDTLMGLEAGADDYVAKPFRPRELRARVEAMLRRPRSGPAPGRTSAPAAGPAPVPAAPPSTSTVPVGFVPTAAPVAAAAPAPAPPAPPAAVPVAPEQAAASPEPVRPAVADSDLQPGWIEHRGLRLHPEMHLVRIRGEEIDLTRMEFELLHLLMTSRRRVRSKADLALAMHGESYVTNYSVTEADKRAIEVHLANLRRKLGENAADPTWIETVRGVGYRLTADG
ncbi:response regulator transcription factor [Agromyces sp. MMS24-JH15]|uniref:response regulator transcription factor n=1 Tax=Agromyces sp. MMS24-JH15 TaxID=3243765 RepID=UPI00374909B9